MIIFLILKEILQLRDMLGMISSLKMPLEGPWAQSETPRAAGDNDPVIFGGRSQVTFTLLSMCVDYLHLCVTRTARQNYKAISILEKKIYEENV